MHQWKLQMCKRLFRGVMLKFEIRGVAFLLCSLLDVFACFSNNWRFVYWDILFVQGLDCETKVKLDVDVIEAILNE